CPATPLPAASLHDALPILAPRDARARGSGRHPLLARRRPGREPRHQLSGEARLEYRAQAGELERLRLGHRADRRTRLAWLRVLRSEEHTSELQSRVDLVCR